VIALRESKVRVHSGAAFQMVDDTLEVDLGAFFDPEPDDLAKGTRLLSLGEGVGSGLCRRPADQAQGQSQGEEDGRLQSHHVRGCFRWTEKEGQVCQGCKQSGRRVRLLRRRVASDSHSRTHSYSDGDGLGQRRSALLTWNKGTTLGLIGVSA